MKSIRSIVFACATLMPAAASAQDAFVWADRPDRDSYTPSQIYAYNPSGDITINRRQMGLYTVTFAGFGTGQGEASPAIGGHVQVSAYGSAGRCNIRNWDFSGADFTVNVMCFEPDSDQYQDNRFTLLVRRAPPTVMMMTTSSEEMMALQAAVAELSARVDVLEAP